MSTAAPEDKRRELKHILVAWVILSLAVAFLARHTTTEPGLYYDEAQAAGLMRDFLAGHARSHMPDTQVVQIDGRPFPVFLQNYIGAVKSWMLLPTFALFGANMTVLRLTALAWTLVILLVFMLWAGRWLGAPAAIIAAVLLALDPSFFYMATLDWGLVLPSFLCRFACFYFALRAWTAESKSLWPGFLAGVFAGLGFFNKIDFAIPLGGVVVALLCANAGRLKSDIVRRELRRRAPLLTAVLAGFLLPAAPMLAHLPGIFRDVSSVGHQPEFAYKLHVFASMLDGSYFERLMTVGGMFETIFDTPAPMFGLLGIGLVVAAVYLIVRKAPHAPFLLLATGFITLGVMCLTGAVRIHHITLIYPFPHLIIAWAATRTVGKIKGAALAGIVAVSQLYPLLAAQRVIDQTGGRGRWSNALNVFAESVKNRSDLTLVSLDWGFNEQLAFLTDGPKLAEPFWGNRPPETGASHIVYLTHSPKYSVFPFGWMLLQEAEAAGSNVYDVKAWNDNQGHAAFYTFQRKIPASDEIHSGQKRLK